MSRKFLDDHIQIKNDATFLPINATVYDASHEYANMHDGTVYVNEGSRVGGSIFGSPRDNRYDLTEQFLQKPGLAADLDPASFAQATNRLYTLGNKQFNVTGTNSTTALSTFAVGGGVTLTTAGASADQMIIIPAAQQNSLDISAWNVGFLSDNRPIFETVIKTAASIASVTIWAGLKLTNTSVVATDNDQTFFEVATNSSSVGNWTCQTSNTNVDTTQDSGLALVASTSYHLKISVGVDRVPRYYINGKLKATGPALATAITWKPYVGVQATAAAAKAISVRYLRCVKDNI